MVINRSSLVEISGPMDVPGPRRPPSPPNGRSGTAQMVIFFENLYMKIPVYELKAVDQSYVFF